MTLIPLWQDERNRRRAPTYDHGTKVCLNCPLPASTCDYSKYIEDVTYTRPAEPVCLNDYTVWKLSHLTPVQAYAAGDRLSYLLDPDDPESADRFRRAVDKLAQGETRGKDDEPKKGGPPPGLYSFPLPGREELVRLLRDYSYEDIARKFGTTLNTVRARCRRMGIRAREVRRAA